ncbi:hypothetical protein GGI12_002284 [Dipsacomyces acuminosporus]|nr:hypothetical protein GGI12_002284 [Dipsacomyces acuminosporus]
MFAFPILSNADTVLNITSAATDMPIFVPAEQDLGKESSSISNSTAHCHSEFLSGVAVTPQPAYTEYMRGAFDGPMLNPTTTPAAYSSVAIDSTAFPANTESAIVAGISTSGLARLSGVGDRSRRVKRMGRRRSLSLSGCIRGHPGSSGMCPAASESQTSIHTSFASHAGTLPPSCQQSPLASPRLGHVGRRRHRAGSESVARSYKKSILGCSPQGSVFGDSDAGLSTRTAKQRLRAHTISQGFKKLSIRSNSSSPTKGSSRNSGANKQLSATDDESCNMKAGSHDEKQEESAGAGTRGQTVSGRIPLTDEQRREYFLWLYRNAHDPKPKGKERERLRAIGNMSRERFKTWFANARRRYFRITENNGIQRYVINSRFKDACKRANIQLN